MCRIKPRIDQGCMSKISASLELRMDCDTDGVFDVLITLKDGADTNDPVFRGCRRLTNNIVAASLSSDQLRCLAEMDEVLAIEPEGMAQAL
jgi:hypothetical protein